MSEYNPVLNDSTSKDRNFLSSNNSILNQDSSHQKKNNSFKQLSEIQKYHHKGPIDTTKLKKGAALAATKFVRNKTLFEKVTLKFKNGFKKFYSSLK